MVFKINRALLSGGLALLGLSLAAPVGAKPPGPRALCDTWPEVAGCAEDQPPGCDACHTTPPARNAFGLSIEAMLLPEAERPLSDADFASGVATVLSDLADADADEDGYANLIELRAGTSPGNANEKPAGDGCSGESTNPRWNVCGYDAAYVYKRVHLDVCGYSPDFEDVEAFGALDADGQDNVLTQALNDCVRTRFWRGRDGVLWRMAHRKITPLQAIKSGRNAGPVPLADYDVDYAFFTYTQTEDRDARLLLNGDHMVEWDEEADTYSPIYRVRGQNLDPQHRVGIITTPWFFVINTMFTPIPRTTAAQAYRSYLGLDIAKSQGLIPPEGEALIDYDAKGITEPACATCHTTLDPLSYPFSRYVGIAGELTGSYAPGRIAFESQRQGLPRDQARQMARTPEAGYLFGEPVANLVEWGTRAAESDAFAEATVRGYWRLLVGHDPTAEERAEFETLWRAFASEHDHRVERMLQALIRTEAYGVP